LHPDDYKINIGYHVKIGVEMAVRYEPLDLETPAAASRSP